MQIRGDFLKSRTLMIRPHSTPREWGRGLRCSLNVDPFLETILLLTEISINWFYFCQTPHQYPHSLLSTQLNYSDCPLLILLDMCFDFQQLYLYRYLLQMKMRLVSNYGKCYFRFLDIQPGMGEGEKTRNASLEKLGFYFDRKKKDK